MTSEISSLDEKRAQKERVKLANGVAENLGVDTEGLAAIVGDSVEGVQNAFIEALDRAAMYHAHDAYKAEQERQRGLDPDTCYNAVCANYKSHEDEHTEPDPDNPELEYIVLTGRKCFCKEGQAQSCIFRMLEHPYSDPFVDIPSHNECVRILQRIGYVRGGSFEKELGTNFMQHKNTGKLWHAYVLLLVETGRVKIPEGEWKDLSECHADNLDHAKFCGGQDLAHEYFRNTELPDTVATIGELVAQRNALLAFIRGELDWPDGRCPCGEDYSWNHVAHTEHCRFKKDDQDDRG